MMEDYFGKDMVESTKKKLESHFEFKVQSLRDYFEAVDARVAELKHLGGGLEMTEMQR